MHTSSESRAAIALLVTAHCDDAVLWAGGTILRWKEAGWRVVVGVANHTAPRRAESLKASKLLGHTLVYREESLPSQWVQSLVEHYEPEVLVTHPANDPHPDHAFLSKSTIEALCRSKRRRYAPKRWYAFDSYYLTRTSSCCPILVDISDMFGQKIAALRMHQSQAPENLILMAKNTNGLHGMRARVQYAEAFHPFDLLGRWPRLRNLP